MQELQKTKSWKKQMNKIDKQKPWKTHEITNTQKVQKVRKHQTRNQRKETSHKFNKMKNNKSKKVRTKTKHQEFVFLKPIDARPKRALSASLNLRTA